MASVSVQPILQFFDFNGDPLVGGKLYTYAAGTTTPLATYTDASGTIANSNPVILNARGEASVWMGSAQYKFILKTSTDVEIWTVDNLNNGDAGTLALLAASNGASLIGYTEGGSSSITTTVQAKLREFISVRDFGASASASAAANLAAFKAAIAATPTGGTLYVPADTSYYAINTSGGLSTVVNVNKRMNIIFDGDVKANYGTLQSNPPYIFNVTADNVSFTGTGKIIGNGTINDANTGTINDTPGLIYVTGDNFYMSGITIDTPPKIGVQLVNCSGARIVGCNFTGGPTFYTNPLSPTDAHTAYFAIKLYQGGNHTISNNVFSPDANGGMYVDCVFADGSNYNTLSGNTAISPYEKFCYLYSSYNTVVGNTVQGNYGSIPIGGDISNVVGGTVTGTLTSVYRLVGSFNNLIGNIADRVGGGATLQNGSGTVVTGNVFTNCGQQGIVFIQASGAPNNFFGCEINGNYVSGTALAGFTLDSGILIQAQFADAQHMTISNNTVSGFSTGFADSAQIKIRAISPYSIRYFTVANNTLYGGALGIHLMRVGTSTVKGNAIRDCSSYGLYENSGANACANIRWDSNNLISSNVGIGNLSATSFGIGNQYTATPLTGYATLSAAINSTITHGGVADNATIYLTPKNSQAGLIVGTKGYVTNPSSTNFVISMANGTAAAGTEQFWYNIVQ